MTNRAPAHRRKFFGEWYTLDAREERYVNGAVSVAVDKGRPFAVPEVHVTIRLSSTYVSTIIASKFGQSEHDAVEAAEKDALKYLHGILGAMGHEVQA